VFSVNVRGEYLVIIRSEQLAWTTVQTVQLSELTVRATNEMVNAPLVYFINHHNAETW